MSWLCHYDWFIVFIWLFVCCGGFCSIKWLVGIFYFCVDGVKFLRICFWHLSLWFLKYNFNELLKFIEIAYILVSICSNYNNRIQIWDEYLIFESIQSLFRVERNIIMSEEGATVNSNNDQSNKEGMIINTDHIAMMPPLPDVTTPSRARRKPPNSYAFKLNNTVRIESISNKKLKLGKEGYIQHPVSLECYKKFLNQSNIKKIPEDNQDGFRQQMSMFLDDKKKFRCYSQNHNKHTKYTCVQSLLSIDSNKRICIDVVTSFWQLHLNTRNEIFSNKVYNIMGSKVTSTMAEPSSMKNRVTTNNK